MKTIAHNVRGFSLLEVLVAFLILSLSLGVLLHLFATGLRNAVLTDEYTQATAYAESILAAYGRDKPLEEGVQEGAINERFTWRGTVKPYTEDVALTEKPVLLLYHLQVDVQWRGGLQPRSVVLETLRWAPLPPATTGG